MNRYAVKPGRRAVVFTNNDSAYGAAAANMSSAGIDIAAIADSRTSVPEIARSRVPDLEVGARSSRRWGRTLIWLRKHSRSCLSETARWPECLRGSHALALSENYHSKLTCGRGVCSRFGQPAWKQARHGITQVGSETNHVLRVERGFVSLGHEVDGTVTRSTLA